MPSFREACPRRGPDPPLHLHSHANRKQDSSALAGPGQSAPSSAPMTQPGQPAPPPPPALSWQKPQLGALGGSQTGGRRGAPGCQTWRLQAGQLRFPGKEEGAVNSASWVLRGGVKGPHAITEQSQFPEAIGRLSSCRKRACWLPGSSVFLPSSCSSFPERQPDFEQEAYFPDAPRKCQARRRTPCAQPGSEARSLGASQGLASSEPGGLGAPGLLGLSLPPSQNGWQGEGPAWGGVLEKLL